VPHELAVICHSTEANIHLSEGMEVITHFFVPLLMRGSHLERSAVMLL
jgi:hypothetical protein